MLIGEYKMEYLVIYSPDDPELTRMEEVDQESFVNRKRWAEENADFEVNYCCVTEQVQLLIW